MEGSPSYRLQIRQYPRDAGLPGGGGSSIGAAALISIPASSLALIVARPNGPQRMSLSGWSDGSSPRAFGHEYPEDHTALGRTAIRSHPISYPTGQALMTPSPACHQKFATKRNGLMSASGLRCAQLPRPLMCAIIALTLCSGVNLVTSSVKVPGNLGSSTARWRLLWIASAGSVHLSMTARSADWIRVQVHPRYTPIGRG